MRRLTIAAAFLALLLVGQAYADDPIEVEIAAIDETPGQIIASIGVYDENGKPITDLTGANFKAALDRVSLPIVSARSGRADRVPASLLLLVDVSGSMQGEPINQARRSLLDFVDNTDSSDSIALLAFDTKVTLLQDYTTSHASLAEAINKLTPLGNTALYSAVIEATEKATTAPEARKLIILLSDGTATVGLDQRAASIAAAREAGIGIISIGLGAGIDRQYLTELTEASNGRFLDAPTPAALRQAYTDLAVAIRSQYTVTIDVPASVDRTVPGDLAITVSRGANSTTVTRSLDALAGALPPRLDLTIAGVTSGQSLESSVTVAPSRSGDAWVSVEYSIDNEIVHTVAGEPFGYEIDPLVLAGGNHVLEVRATDASGRQGEAQVAFSVPAIPGGSLSLPVGPLAAVAASVGLLGAIFLILRRRARNRPRSDFADRVRPWASRGNEPQAGPGADWNPEPPTLVAAVDEVLGRVVVMDESAISGGSLEGIREYAIGSAPLTLGSGRSCDVVIPDETQTIAAEEARIWINRGRLVYHKLTTLSAMATEGVTSGWQFLDSGEEIQLGRHRVLFQADVKPELEEVSAELPSKLPQEHGMALQDFWPSSLGGDDSSQLPVQSD